MTAPTKASLQRAEKQARDALEMRDKVIKMHDRAWETNAALRAEIADLKAAARPVVAYMDTQWPGSVGPELRRLKELCK